MDAPRIIASQLGYLCSASKRIYLRSGEKGASGGAGPQPAAFEIQDMAQVDSQILGGDENWKPVYRGSFTTHSGPMGDWLVGDFSSLTRPGLYRAVLPGGVPPKGGGVPPKGGGVPPTEWSFPFVVSDGAYSRLIPLFLNYVHSQRCGDFENELRGPCHLDDGRRSDTGEPVDVVGGWHDAGDLRKWMGTTPMPVLGFFALRDNLGYARNWWGERPHEDDVLAEASWGLRWMLKMQDPGTGMFYEDVGGGGDARHLPGMAWWYENHAGCYADNSGNYFSDNRRASGDERQVRVQYNPIVQYLAVTILMDAVDHFKAHYPAFSLLCRQSALRCWEFMKSRRRDEYHGWASVLSWRLLAALRLHATGVVAESEVSALVSVLLDLQSPDRGFWFMDNTRREPYRGILHSAQPLIALSAFIEADYEHPLVATTRDALARCRDRFVLPMLATNPFGIMPYGLYSSRRTDVDVYHELPDGLLYRFFMPEHAPERINHGLAAHWTSWAHGLAVVGRVLESEVCRQAALHQLEWLMGCNPLGVSVITGVGYRNATPYSRFYGPLPGGFCVGPRGDAQDEIWLDTEGRNVWNSGEYWMPPLANALLALSNLLPARVLPSGKVG